MCRVDPRTVTTTTQGQLTASLFRTVSIQHTRDEFMPPGHMTPASHFDLIVFDWDGTLFDSTALIARCIHAACADLEVTVPTDAQASYVIGMGLIEALQHAAPDLPRERYRDLGER